MKYTDLVAEKKRLQDIPVTERSAKENDRLDELRLLLLKLDKAVEHSHTHVGNYKSKLV